ncbi:MAG: hypothetical protein ACRCZI_11410 [Cetobacterium sp.]
MYIIENMDTGQVVGEGRTRADVLKALQGIMVNPNVVGFTLPRKGYMTIIAGMIGVDPTLKIYRQNTGLKRVD